MPVALFVRAFAKLRRDALSRRRSHERNRISGARRANVTGFGAREFRVEGFALPKSVVAPKVGDGMKG
jgi:hypothetical protein